MLRLISLSFFQTVGRAVSYDFLFILTESHPLILRIKLPLCTYYYYYLFIYLEIKNSLRLN